MDFVLKIVPCREKITIQIGSWRVESDKCLVLLEQRCSAVVYFPVEVLDQKAFIKSHLSTFCPFKGNAKYWHFLEKERSRLNCVWSYEETTPEVKQLESYVAFDIDHPDVQIETPDDFEKTFPCHRNHHPNPLVDWLLQNTQRYTECEDLVRSFFEYYRLVIDPEVIAFNVVVRTLHPQLLGYRYTWRAGEERLREYEANRSILDDRAYQNSPVKPVVEGRGGFFARIYPGKTGHTYPILDDFAEHGGTDYVAFPMFFLIDK